MLSGGTALLFLGLEGLALEGGQGEEATSKHRLSKPICVSFLACVCGLYSMMVGMIPPRPRRGIRLILSGIPDETTREVERYVSGVIRLTLVFDAAMIVAIVFVMFLVMYTLMKLPAFLLLVLTIPEVPTMALRQWAAVLPTIVALRHLGGAVTMSIQNRHPWSLPRSRLPGSWLCRSQSSVMARSARLPTCSSHVPHRPLLLALCGGS